MDFLLRFCAARGWSTGTLFCWFFESGSCSNCHGSIAG